jgi:hypothetical protein
MGNERYYAWGPMDWAERIGVWIGMTLRLAMIGGFFAVIVWLIFW